MHSSDGRTPALDQVVFCGMGGSGSTYLRHALARAGLTVHNKPDIVHHRYWVKQGRSAQREEFGRRANGFELGTEPGIAGIRHYLDRLAATPDTTAVLGTWAEQQLLRHAGRRRIVFLLREPAAAYRSMCDPERHGDIAEQYGGPDSWYAVFYAERWRKIAEEYLALRAAGWDVTLWSYEHLPECARRDGFGEVVTEWRLSPPRLKPALRDETIDLIRACTSDVRRALDIPEWDQVRA
ncbi:hypothetical protein ABT186_36330 [Streptomyces sp. NPDC001634]|uniref:hypothetical protein n=1 Tax=Streptomyces sp. NPDC001634 TaxID=3154390 RepID=UPI003317A113